MMFQQGYLEWCLSRLTQQVTEGAISENELAERVATGYVSPVGCESLGAFGETKFRCVCY